MEKHGRNIDLLQPVVVSFTPSIGSSHNFTLAPRITRKNDGFHPELPQLWVYPLQTPRTRVYLSFSFSLQLLHTFTMLGKSHLSQYFAAYNDFRSTTPLYPLVYFRNVTAIPILSLNFQVNTSLNTNQKFGSSQVFFSRFLYRSDHPKIIAAAQPALVDPGIIICLKYLSASVWQRKRPLG